MVIWTRNIVMAVRTNFTYFVFILLILWVF
jgi:hypothetical protein